ncbi:NADH-quinone oxidoreductase subunit J [Buchnera aphidicola]|uniref:NADH-quinone oxidoreductase subunit J family protein n=1 Tax=Buchnera aphidicola TaxID=9 RepID=UPI0034644B06
MFLIFNLLSYITIVFTVFSIIQKNIMYALFYFSLSMLTTSCILFLLGNYFIASLQIIIYSGAILVLFVFVVMMLNYSISSKNRYNIKINYFYIFLFCFFIILMLYRLLLFLKNKYISIKDLDLNAIGINLFESYILIVEFVSILLLSILIIVFLVSKKKKLFQSSICTNNRND